MFGISTCNVIARSVLIPLTPPCLPMTTPMKPLLHCHRGKAKFSPARYIENDDWHGMQHHRQRPGDLPSRIVLLPSRMAGLIDFQQPSSITRATAPSKVLRPLCCGPRTSRA